VQTYQIIEGEIAFATNAGGRIIFHFAKDGKSSFTATVDSAVRKKLTGQSLDDWQGQKVRIRGWIERKKGPTIAIIQPEQLELLKREPAIPTSPDSPQ
jgi:hypothetical protein